MRITKKRNIEQLSILFDKLHARQMYAQRVLFTRYKGTETLWAATAALLTRERARAQAKRAQ